MGALSFGAAADAFVQAGEHELPQVERAYRALKTGVRQGRYPPGTPLSELSVGMSRTPVREAFARLWQEHYLDRVRGHGYFVAHVTAQAIHDTFEVRRLLEAAAARRAAETATVADLDQLRRFARIPDHRIARRAQEIDTRFHLAVASCARNTLSLELIDRCLAQIDRFMALAVRFPSFPDGVADAHLGIVDAIASRNSDLACTRMEAHLDAGRELLQQSLFAGSPPATSVRWGAGHSRGTE